MYMYLCCPLCGRNLYINHGEPDTLAIHVISEPHWSKEHVLPKFLPKAINNFYSVPVMQANDPRNIVLTHKKCNREKGATIRFPYERGDTEFLLSSAEDFNFVQRHVKYLIEHRKYITAYFRRTKIHYIFDTSDCEGPKTRKLDFSETRKSWLRFLALYDSGIKYFQ